ncbi:MAG: hypothetical protein AB9Q18_11145 [Candidatus Reddybacter sp.]
MMHFMAYLSTLSILVLMVFVVNGGVRYPFYLLAGVAVVAICTLLVRVFHLAAQHNGWGSAPRYWMQGHVLLHLVPLSYLVLQFFSQPSVQVNGLYLLPVLLFFFSGRQTWRVLFEQFGAKMYRVFYLGNTGMMTGHVLLMGLGVLYDARFGTEFFCRTLVAYTSIHLLILGFAVLTIERDIILQAPRSA